MPTQTCETLLVTCECVCGCAKEKRMNEGVYQRVTTTVTLKHGCASDGTTDHVTLNPHRDSHGSLTTPSIEVTIKNLLYRQADYVSRSYRMSTFYCTDATKGPA